MGCGASAQANGAVTPSGISPKPSNGAPSSTTARKGTAPSIVVPNGSPGPGGLSHHNAQNTPGKMQSTPSRVRFSSAAAAAMASEDSEQLGGASAAQSTTESQAGDKISAREYSGGQSPGVAPLRGPMLAMASYHSKGSSFGGDDSLECGVTLAWLQRFAEGIDHDMTTEEVVQRVIIPETAELKCRYSDLIPSECLGVPTYFVSHMWTSKFSNTIGALHDYLEDKDPDAIIWVDIFAINQWPEQRDNDLAVLQRVVKRVKKTLLCLDSQGQALTRLWVLYEIWQTVVAKTAAGLQIVTNRDVDFRHLQKIFAHLDVTEANSSIDEDRAKLLGGIKGSISHAALNHVIKKALGDSAMLEAQNAGDHLEAESSDLAEALLQCAHFLQSYGRYADAEPICRHSLDVLEHTLGHTHSTTSEAMNSLGQVLHHQGKHEEAEKLLREALQLDEQAHGQGHPSTYVALSSLASLLQDQGKLTEAEPMLRRALDMQEAAEPPTAPADLAVSLLNLASVLHKLNDLGAAEAMARRSLAIREECYGPDNHPYTTAAINTVAGLLKDQDKMEEAEALYRRSLTCTQISLGNDHPDTAWCWHHLALLLQRLKRLDEAVSLLQKALKACEVSLGPTHASVATNLSAIANIMLEQGKVDESVPLLRRAVEINDKALGQDHLNTAQCLVSLAQALQAQGKYKESEALLRRAVHVQEKSLGHDHELPKASRRRLSMVVNEWSKSAAKEH